MMKSNTVLLYKSFLECASKDDIDFVDDVYHLCELNYDKGGDVIVECFTPNEILEVFSTLTEVKDYCGLKVEQELNARWGSDDDSELNRRGGWRDA